jgi:hypothetical protein
MAGVGSGGPPVPAELRNRLLRWADWRLLLPTPMPASVAILADGHAVGAMRLIADELVEHPAEFTSGRFDLVVVGDSRVAALQQANTMLRPGGSLQLELRRASTLGVRWIRRRLDSMGFEILGVYCPLPPSGPGAPNAWLPLGSPAALRYFVSTRPQGRSLKGRIGLAARRVGWRLRGRALLPTTAVILARKQLSEIAGPSLLARSAARRPAPQRNTDTDLLGRIHAELQTLPLEDPADRCSLLLFTPGKQSINKVVGLVFREPDPRPRLVVKLPRIPEAIPGLRNEEHVLRRLQKRAGSPISGVPKILFSFMHGELPVVGQTFVSGRTLSSLLNPGSARGLALKATDWLIELARSGPSAPPRHPAALVTSTLEAFAAQFGSVVDYALLRLAEETLATLGPLPVVVEQRDFSPWNLRLDESSSLVVHDWESAVEDGLPFLDLFYLLSHLSFSLGRAARPEEHIASLRAARDPSTSMGRISAECIARYAGCIGVLPSAVAPLRILLWMIHSRSEFRQLCRDLEASPDASALRESLFVRLWEEEVRRISR